MGGVDVWRVCTIIRLYVFAKVHSLSFTVFQDIYVVVTVHRSSKLVDCNHENVSRLQQHHKVGCKILYSLKQRMRNTTQSLCLCCSEGFDCSIFFTKTTTVKSFRRDAERCGAMRNDAVIYTSGSQPWSSGPPVLHVLDVSLLKHTWFKWMVISRLLQSWITTHSFESGVLEQGNI